MPKKKVTYVVTAYKWGDRKDHSYIVGAFAKKYQAMKAADGQVNYRGGKYGCAVEEVPADVYDQDLSARIVYYAKSVGNNLSFL